MDKLSVHKECIKLSVKTSDINTQYPLDEFKHYFPSQYFSTISSLYPLPLPFHFPYLSFHSLCKNIWSIHSCIRQRCDNGVSVVSWQTHTQRSGRKQLKDVIGQMRIMGLQFGLGQGKCLAAVRQRRAINTDPFSPPARSAGKLVLSINLPANIELNKPKPCNSINAPFGIRGVYLYMST